MHCSCLFCMHMYACEYWMFLLTKPNHVTCPPLAATSCTQGALTHASSAMERLQEPFVSLCHTQYDPAVLQRSQQDPVTPYPVGIRVRWDRGWGYRGHYERGFVAGWQPVRVLMCLAGCLWCITGPASYSSCDGSERVHFRRAPCTYLLNRRHR